MSYEKIKTPQKDKIEMG